MFNIKSEDFLPSVRRRLPGASKTQLHFYQAVDGAARNRGYRLYFVTLAGLIAINEYHQDVYGARPLTSTMLPIGGADDENTLILVAVDEDGEVIGTRAVLWLDLGQLSFAEYATSLLLFYKDPRDKRLNESCEVHWPEVLEPFTGEVLLGTAVYVLPRLRSGGEFGISSILSLVGRVFAYDLCPEVDVYLATLVQKLIDDGTAEKLLFRERHGGVFVMHNSIASPKKPLTLGLGSSTRKDMHDDVAWFLSEFPIKLAS